MKKSLKSSDNILGIIYILSKWNSFKENGDRKF